MAGGVFGLTILQLNWDGNLTTNILCHNKDPSPTKVRIRFNEQVCNLCVQGDSHFHPFLSPRFVYHKLYCSKWNIKIESR